MKTYLEYKDEKSQKFWEISVSENNIITRYGKIGSNGKEISKPFENNAIAVYEMYKQILAKRKKGYAMPNSITMSKLLKYPVTNLSDLDKSLYSSLEINYKTVIFIDGDITLDELNLDIFKNARGLIVTGNLYVNGGIYNTCGDTGAFLIVIGNVIADYIVAGGSEIYLSGKSDIHTFTVGFYNGGILSILDINTFCYINSDHSCDISGEMILKLRVFEDQDDIGKLKNIFTDEIDFLECEEYEEGYYDEDEEEEEAFCDLCINTFNEHLFDDKKRLNLLKMLANSL